MIKRHQRRVSTILGEAGHTLPYSAKNISLRFVFSLDNNYVWKNPLINSLRMKEFCYLTDFWWRPFWLYNLDFCILLTWNFHLLNYITPRRLSKYNSGKFWEIWVWLGMTGHTQLKVLVPDFLLLWWLFPCKKYETDSLIPSGDIDYQISLPLNRF